MTKAFETSILFTLVIREFNIDLSDRQVSMSIEKHGFRIAAAEVMHLSDHSASTSMWLRHMEIAQDSIVSRTNLFVHQWQDLKLTCLRNTTTVPWLVITFRQFCKLLTSVTDASVDLCFTWIRPSC